MKFSTFQRLKNKSHIDIWIDKEKAFDNLNYLSKMETSFNLLNGYQKNHREYPISVQSSLVAQSCPTLCNLMNRSTPGLPVHHQLPESTQTLAHWVGDAIQPSHPLSPPSPPALNLSQHQGLFKWVSPSHQVASVGVSASTSVLPMNTQNWFPLGWAGWMSLQSKGLSRVFSNTTIQKHQLFCAHFSL